VVGAAGAKCGWYEAQRADIERTHALDVCEQYRD
jgi:hypothetical protein